MSVVIGIAKIQAISTTASTFAQNKLIIFAAER
jgi:hypothetical protein